MPAAVSKIELQRTADVLARHNGHQPSAGKELGIVQSAVARRLEMIRRAGIKPSAGVEDPNNLAHVKQQLKRAQTELAQAREQALDAATIKRKIIGLKEGAERAEIPNWVLTPRGPDSAPGVPILFLSDLHWGEVVHPTQINGVNRYSIEIAHQRLDHLASTAVHLLEIISPKMDYPGLVMPVGGDMISCGPDVVSFAGDNLVVTRDDASKAYLLDRAVYAELAGVLSEDVRWRAVKARAMASRAREEA